MDSEQGTCVVLTAPDGELAEQAAEILKRFGPVHAGSAAGDFGVIDLEVAEGWVVTGHHNDVLTYSVLTSLTISRRSLSD
ncbi:hypothetical protein ACFWP5_34135 [Streptomyces sp. NPDC058469]|uniref:hypothetical protein n=1 Tax=Streptomyces sp. NPDC058469 TaxID=3346514 RepID=UPI003661A1BD